jgi:farnesyl-diphosphate farnesyltransferase
MQTEHKTALKILEETSRTFYIPIVKLPTGAQEAVASAYLCLRAIDEVEDHPKIDNATKTKILRDISYGIQKYKPYSTSSDLKFNWHGQETVLPEVSLRLA